MMREKTVTVTIPDDTVEWLRNQVQSGHYASVEDVIRAGVSLLRDQSEFEEGTESDEVARMVAESYDEANRHPESLIPADQVIREMEERHRNRLKQAS